MNLYLDFDGVIADTIKVTYKIIRQKGIDLTDKEKVFEFYRGCHRQGRRVSEGNAPRPRSSGIDGCVR